MASSAAVHFSHHAPSAAGAARVSARGASLFVCAMMRATLGLAAHELQPEMMRRCKTMLFEGDEETAADANQTEAASVHDDHASASAAAAASSSQSHASIVRALWKCIHACVALEEMQPLASIDDGEILTATLAPPCAGTGISSFVAASAPTAPPLTALRAGWTRASAQPDAMRSKLLATLHSWGCDLPWVQPKLHNSGGGAHPLPPDRWNARQCLLVLDWCSERVGLRQRYVRMLAGEHAHGFFHASPIATAAAAASSSNRSARSSSSSSSPMQFTQPLLPPALYDSAAALSGSGIVDQSDEFRLLQQLLREGETRAAAAAAPASAAASAVSASSSMCLPPPSPSAASSSFASPALPATAPVTILDSYADRRLSHRAFQCISLLGRLRTRITKLSAVTAERSRILVALQNLQRHPGLRGKVASTISGAASPFEIQCAMAGRSSVAATATHASLRRWLDETSSSLPAAAAGAIPQPQQLQDHWDRNSAVWRAWIDSVAAVQRQAEEEEAAAAAAQGEGDARVASSAASSASASASSSLDSARGSASARGVALPPHLRAAARTAAAARSARPTGAPSALDDACSPAGAAAALPEPSVAFWKAITAPLTPATASDAEAGAPTALEWLLRRRLRDPIGSYVLNAEEREELEAFAADSSVEQSNGAASSRSSSAAAVAVPPRLRLSNPSACASLSLLAESHRARDAHRRLAYCTLVEQAMRQAADQGRDEATQARPGYPGKSRVAFTVHT